MRSFRCPRASVRRFPRRRSALAGVLEMIAATAADRDGESLPPPFPDDAFALLEEVGALAWNATPVPADPGPPMNSGSCVPSRALTPRSAGSSTGTSTASSGSPCRRRWSCATPSWRRSGPGSARRSLGRRSAPSRGSPATLVSHDGVETLSGVKTFCSGAGGLDRALVLARDPDGGPPVAVWIDLTDPASVIVDEHWYRCAGLRASVSHRVVFRRVPVLARFGPRADSLSSRGSAATRCAPPRAGRGWPTGRSDARSTSWPPGRRAGPLEQLAAGRMLSCATDDRRLARERARVRWTPPDRTSRRSRCMRRSRSREPAGRCWTRPPAPADRIRSRPAATSIAPVVTSSCSCCSTGSIRRSSRPARARSTPEASSDESGRVRAALPAGGDPWGYRSSDYEHAKYDATLDACGAGRSASALELGGSIGVFSARLAPRAVDALTTIDCSPTAVGAARPRARRLPSARALVGEIPAAIRTGSHDLVVASEILYYLDDDALTATLERLERGARRLGGSSRCTGDRPDPSAPRPRSRSTPGCGLCRGSAASPIAAPPTTCCDVLERR